MIISNFTNNITEYMNLEKEICIASICGCNTCGYGGRLHRHGYYFRNVITRDVIARIPILRLKCPSCNKTRSVLPSFLIPYYQYSFNVIFEVLYLSYVVKDSYSKIVCKFNKSNPNGSFSSSNIYTFRNRMQKAVAVVNSFFSSFDKFYYSMNHPTAELVLKKIKEYTEVVGDFNHDYFRLMPRYFFSKF